MVAKTVIALRPRAVDGQRVHMFGASLPGHAFFLERKQMRACSMPRFLKGFPVAVGHLGLMFWIAYQQFMRVHISCRLCPKAGRCSTYYKVWGTAWHVTTQMYRVWQQSLRLVFRAGFA